MAAPCAHVGVRGPVRNGGRGRPFNGIVSRRESTGVELLKLRTEAKVGAVEKLELLIKSLSPEELAQFREWFADFDAQFWDRQIETDTAAGKLDRLIDESMADHRAQKSRPL